MLALHPPKLIIEEKRHRDHFAPAGDNVVVFQLDPQVSGFTHVQRVRLSDNLLNRQVEAALDAQ